MTGQKLFEGILRWKTPASHVMMIFPLLHSPTARAVRSLFHPMTDSEIKDAIHDMGRRARAASRELVKLSTEQKNSILLAMADEIQARETLILAENAKDLARAEENGLSKAMLDRLTLDPKRLAAVAQAVREVATLPDPVGEVL